MKLLHGLMKVILYPFRKSPKATNEMKPVEVHKYIIHSMYWKVKKSWKRSAKNYSIYYNLDTPWEYGIVKNYRISSTTFQNKNNVVVGNLYELYQQYYGKENKGKS